MVPILALPNRLMRFNGLNASTVLTKITITIKIKIKSSSNTGAAEPRKEKEPGTKRSHARRAKKTIPTEEPREKALLIGGRRRSVRRGGWGAGLVTVAATGEHTQQAQ